MSESIEFIRGSLKEPQVARLFEEALLQAEDLSGLVIYGYPLGQGHLEGLISPDAVYLAPNGQVTIVHMVSGEELPRDYTKTQDDMFLAVDRKLRASPKMRNGRDMRIQPQTVTYGPDLTKSDLEDPDYPVANTQDLLQTLRTFQKQDLNYPSMEDVQEAILASNSNTGFW